jgi:UDP-N-acetylglucosamine/UDP-N-acetylgalactosamine diphosphorylase
MNSLPSDLQALLRQYGQTHLIQFWDDLNSEERANLAAQLIALDFALVESVTRSLNAPDSSNAGSEAVQAARIAAAKAPAKVVRQPQSTKDLAARSAAAEIGEAELRSGKVAVVTVAGGQGTRLGFDAPKGMFPIGPVSQRTLFQIFAEQIQSRRQQASAEIPWFIMTSDATHSETKRFFEDQNYFGMVPESVVLFQQGSLPAFDASTGQILLNSRSEIALSPDGHGGLIAALQKAGLLERMKNAGIEHVFYHQVDNPTVIIADPVLIGFHTQQKSQLTTNVVCKTSPTEKMGVLVDVNGRTEIIEYSELTPEQAAQTDESGQWIFWAGNTAIHVFDRAFLENLAHEGGQLPLHFARKNVPFVSSEGQMVSPEDASNPNAIKMERFIFDALPMAQSTLIVEGNRAREFNPVKNKSGADSADTARAALVRIGREWLAESGHVIPDHMAVEISPLQALTAAELRKKIGSGELQVSDLISS